MNLFILPAEYRARMLLVSLLDLTDLSSPPHTGEVLDAVLQMFPAAVGATIPMPRQRLLDTSFHGYVHQSGLFCDPTDLWKSCAISETSL